jgi:hypothetical protein
LDYEKSLRQNNCTGAIFALKNFGWKDKTEIEGSLVFNKLPQVTLDNGATLTFNVGD